MGIEITARHMQTGLEIQEYAKLKAEILTKEFSSIEHVHVILDIEKHRKIAEVIVQARNHIRIEAAKSSDNMRASIDSAIEKAERQLRRQRDKVQEHRVKSDFESVKQEQITGAES